ncbi:hypothetical protein RD110_02935 [Rhodoferax koreense]|uniref:Cadherin domain-containing protein n=1 Tax=Rhodoferax koreensis TaxID=1842727 RepID=A0A1P8JRA5_9BURK|nr:DUF4347 domain-containing protein [Rhodoferax koreense]APW36294.1 hypothetical protein RD110_02935 [Rhodoferax koreense]
MNAPASRRRAVLEDIEPRILYAADHPAATALATPWPAQETATASTETQPAPTAPRDATELVFIDERVPDAEMLIADITAQATAGRHIEVVRIGADDDGIALISSTLAERGDVDGVHVVAHGSEGRVVLGDTTLDQQALLQRAGEIAGWGEHLSGGADLLLYGCDVAQGADGQALVQGLAQLTGADVAASVDRTGQASLGGNWTLEMQTGHIEAQLAFDLQTQARWQGVLATYTVTNTNDSGAGSLRQAITNANGNAGTDTINFNIAGTAVHTITLSSALPTITGTVILDATTDNSFAANGNRPAVILDGNNLNADGLELATGSGGSTIRGLIIRNFQGDGIQIDAGSSGNTIAGNYIGSLGNSGNAQGTGNGGAAIDVLGANNVIGGTTGADRNLLSGNANGVLIDGASGTGNQVIGNYIGTNLAGTAAIANAGDGVRIQNGASANTIGGANANQCNIISGNGDDGIQIFGEASDNNVLKGNWIGVGADGATVLGSGGDGIYIEDGPDNTVIGGPGAGEGNWIAGVSHVGIELDGASSGTLVQGNRIGTDLTGTANWGVQQNGILVEDAVAPISGPTNNQFLDNIVAFSGQGGVYTVAISQYGSAGTGNSYMRNLVYGNTGLGIDLNVDGVTANDTGDADTGTNNLQNYPVLTLARTDEANQVTVAGTLNSTANSYFRIEFFASASGNSSGYGLGQIYLGYADVATNASGNGSIAATLNGVDVPAGYVISATATKATSAAYTAFTDTSEFAKNVVAISSTQAVLVVDTNADTVNGDTTSISTLLASKGADGLISLREAITAINNTPAGSLPTLVNFALAGTGVNTITLASALPTITKPVVIDATTDDSFAARGNVPSVVVNMNGVASSSLRLGAGSGGSTVRGLVITNATDAAIYLDTGSDGNTIAGNYLGSIDASGNLATVTNSSYVVYVGSANNVIGGSTAADRNVIAQGNAGYGVLLFGAGATGNAVQGNYIGTNAAGTTRVTAAANAVSIQSGAANNTIGGAGAGQGNVVATGAAQAMFLSGQGSGNVIQGNRVGISATGTLLGGQTAGILISAPGGVQILDNWIGGGTGSGISLSSNSNVVRGNRIGTDLAGTANWGVQQSGIVISGSNNVIGGTSAGQGNVIANANQAATTFDGITVSSGTATGNAILGNSIYGTVAGASGLGIDLGTSGVTANDTGDADTGANNLQNFPVLTQVTTDGSGNVTVSGTLNSTASSFFRIEVFANATKTANGYGEGNTFLGFINVTTDASGNATFSSTLSATVAAGFYITATATASVAGFASFTGTSEFSATLLAISTTQTTLVVDTNADTVNGDTSNIYALLANKGSDGFISLREAISAINNTPAGSLPTLVNFSIAGSGVHTITLGSALPAITRPVLIDGTTDTASVTGNGGRPAIVLDGNGLGDHGLTLTSTAGGSTIRGLVIRNFFGAAISVEAGSDGNTIAGNYLGAVDATGNLAPAANGSYTVRIAGANNTVGGSTAADRNVLGTNGDGGTYGLIISGATANSNQILGNYIGIGADGVTAFSGAQAGITVFDGASNRIEGNVIAADGDYGVYISTAGSGTVVHNNLIGTNAAGTAVVSAPIDGIRAVQAGANTVFTNNVIAGASQTGIRLDASAGGVTVQGNRIGTDAAGTANWGMQRNGIEVASSNNLIGGTGGGQGNIVANSNQAASTYDGIAVSGGTGNAILGNHVYHTVAGTSGVGIDLGTSGVTTNDAGDADTGANNLQNFPVLTVARTDGIGSFEISGSINSTANTYVRIELFANTGASASGYGEGQTWLGFVNVLTDGSGNASFSTTLSATVAAGAFISATATRSVAGYGSFSDTSEFARSVVAIHTTQQNVLVVTTAADTVDGDTTSVSTLLATKGADGFISLREALLAINNTPAGSLPTKINFAIAGTGVHTITLGSTLPTIDRPVVIDGTTDDSFAANGSRPAIVLYGNGAVSVGLNLGANADGSTIRGLVINGITGPAIQISAGSDGNTIAGNYLGSLLPSGGVDNDLNRYTYTGVLIAGGTNNTIGGVSAADRNVMAGFSNAAVVLQAGATGNHVVGNYIGTDAGGTPLMFNSVGVWLLANSQNNTIGGVNPGEGNLIAGNAVGAILMQGANISGNAVLGNSVYANSTNSPAIDLGYDGVTANDPGDTDTGANNLQNFPVLTLAQTDGAGQFTIAGTFNSTANSFFRIELFANTSADASGYGEGQTYIGFVNVATDASGNATFSTTLSATVATGTVISATATRSNAAYNTFTDTSEFAKSVVAISSTQAVLVVDTASDALDGDTTSLSTLLASKGTDGFISLREALIAINNTPAGSLPTLINFGISGTGVHTIVLGSALPQISRPVVIDANTDDSFAANGNRPAIVLQGNGYASGWVGLDFVGGSGGSTVRGLSIQGFDIAIYLETGSDGNTIVGNDLGPIQADGTYTAAAGAQTTWGVVVQSANNTIGGTTAADRNVISGLRTAGGGVYITGAAATGNRVIGNDLGTDASGTPLGLGGESVIIAAGAQNNMVGGTGAGEGNRIAGSSLAGVWITQNGTTGNAVLGNTIYANGGLGIDLGPSGVTPNDAGDADTGANNQQNTPVLASASLVGNLFHITGSLDSEANKTYRIEFFGMPDGSTDGSGHGEGNVYLGALDVTTDASGNASINATLASAGLTYAAWITATATEKTGASSYGSTSEFAANVQTANTAPALSVPASAAYTENAGAVALAPGATVVDTELAAAGHYAGATLTLVRSGGAQAQDLFAATGALSALTQGASLVYGGTTVGTVTTNTSGTLVLTFDSNATQALVNNVLRAIGYANSSDAPPASVQLVWSFSDGNTGVQGSGGALVGSGSTTVTITSVNDAPAGTGKTVTTLEDTAYTFTATDFGFSDVDGNALQGVRIATVPGAGNLTLNGVAVTAGQTISLANIAAGNLKFTPAANANGTAYASFTFQVQDDGGTANGGVDIDPTPRTMTVDVTSVNDAPSGANNTVTTLEDTGYAFSAADFGFSDTDGNSLQSVKITTTPGAGSLSLNGVAVAAGQSISLANITAGNLKFTPAANASGAGYASFTFQVQDNGGTANGGVDIDPSPCTMIVDVTSVNDAPSGANNTVTTTEDTVYTFSVGDFGFSDADGNSLQGIKITTTPGAGSLSLNGAAVTAGQTISLANITAGNLKFTPAANANGAGYASFTFQVQDDGGTANGGVDTDPTPRTMTVNVTSVNDAPTGSDKTVSTLEDTAYIFTATDFGFSDVDGNALQGVRIATVPGAGNLTLNGAAVTAGQSISLANITAGNLKFTPAANASGAGYASFTFQVQDDGGTANGGVDTDPTPRTMTVNVTSVNDAPTGTDRTVATFENTAHVFNVADFGFSDVDGHALLAVKITTAPGAGSLTLNGVAVTAGQMVVAADIAAGDLMFTPAANASGVGYASFSFQVQDNGGTANGGVDIDPSPRTMTVNVTSVNSAPSGANNTVTTTEDTVYTFGVGDFGFSDTDGNSLQSVKITTTPDAGSLSLNGVAVAAGQSISLANITAGNLKFTPAANANGTAYASFTFQVQDDGGTTNGGVDTDPTPRTMTVDVTPVNDAPTVVTSGGTAGYARGGAAVLIDDGLLVADLDDAMLHGASVAISANYESGHDRLGFNDQNGITGHWDAGTGVLTLSGSATLAAYQAALRSITFANDSASPAPATRTVRFTVDDGSVGSIAATRDVVLATPNRAPTITSNGGGADASLSLPENSSVVTTVTATDADTPPQQLTYSIAGGADAGRFTLDASTGVLRFTQAPDAEHPSDADHNGVYEVVVQVSDGMASTAQAIRVTVTDVNEFQVSPLIDTDNAPNIVASRVVNGGPVGITVHASDADATAVVSYSLVDSASGRFTIDPTTGVVTVADSQRLAGDAPGAPYEIVVQATSSDGSARTASFLVRLPENEIAVPVRPPPVAPLPQPPAEPATTSPAAPGTEVATGIQASAPDAIVSGKPGADEGDRSGPPVAPLAIAASRTQRPHGADLQRLAAFHPVASLTERRDLALSPTDALLEALERLRATASGTRRTPAPAIELESNRGHTELPTGEPVVDAVWIGSAALSLGLAIWATRGGALLTSMLSTTPAWQNFDPVPVLRRPKADLGRAGRNRDGAPQSQAAEDSIAAAENTRSGDDASAG